VLVPLLADREGGLGEDEELVLEADPDLEAELVRARQYAAQHASRTELLGRAGELAEEHEVAGLGGDFPAALRNDAYVGVGVGGVPAGEGHVVVELVIAVPAQHHVAEAHAAFEGGLELADMDVFAAQHAIDVVDPDLDVAEPPLLDD